MSLSSHRLSRNAHVHHFFTFYVSVHIFAYPYTIMHFWHTFATYALAKGANPKDVQAILGHSSAQMTMDVYAVSDPAERMAMMEAVSHRQE